MDDASLMHMAKTYADNDDYSVTRQYLYGLLGIIERLQTENAELKRVNGDLVQCANCLEQRAADAYGVAIEAQHAAVGHWRNDK